MEKINFYFFHGFLGTPSDWSPVVENLHPTGSWALHFPNLVELVSPIKPTPSLADFAESFAQDHLDPQQINILVGYSMGGRMAMHIPANYYQKLFLIGAHPGMCRGHETRRHLDQQWLELAQQKSMEEWFHEWNSQPIFRNDRVRPIRTFSEEIFKKHLLMIQAWSLSNQKNQAARLTQEKDKVFWSYGKKDDKYNILAKEMEKTLGSSQVLGIDDAGHGVIFDQPQAIARWIEEVVNVQ